MADFTSKKPSATYKSILNVGTSDNEELGSSLKVIEDGAGNDSAMRLALTGSTSAASFTGNVGIDTNSPTEKLEIKGSTSATRAMVKTTTGNAIFRVDTDTSDFSIVGKGDSNRLDFYDANANATPFKLDGGGTGHVTDTLVVKSGKVGIGTAAPSKALHVISGTGINLTTALKLQKTVDGSGSATGILLGALATGQAKGGIFFENDGSGHGRGNLHFAINTGEDTSEAVLADAKVTIDSTGQVGIGTSSPARKLEVNQGQQVVSTKITGNNASGHIIDIDHANNGVNSYNGFRFLDEGSNARGLSLTHIGASSPSRGKLQIGTAENGSGAILSIDGDNARVGIGTLSPITDLQINSADNTQLQIRSSDGTKVPILSLTNTDRTWQLRCNGGSNDRFEIRDNTASSDNNRFIINTSGQVGIGNAPSAKLHLEQGDFRINSDTNGFQVIEFAEAGTVMSKVGYNHSNDSLNFRTADASGNLDTRINIFSGTDDSVVQIVNDGQSILSLNNTSTDGDQFRIISKVNGSTAGLLFRDESSTTDIMTLTQDGNVGIATATPEYKLKINGAVGCKIPSTVTSVSSNLSVSDTSIIKLDADGGNITIDGLNGGRLGQILHLIKITSNNTVTIKHNNSSGEQKIGTVNDGDYVLSNKEGCTLICIAASSDTVGNWRIVDK